jgi:hypothetical protein
MLHTPSAKARGLPPLHPQYGASNRGRAPPLPRGVTASSIAAGTPTTSVYTCTCSCARSHSCFTPAQLLAHDGVIQWLDVTDVASDDGRSAVASVAAGSALSAARCSSAAGRRAGAASLVSGSRVTATQHDALGRPPRHPDADRGFAEMTPDRERPPRVWVPTPELQATWRPAPGLTPDKYDDPHPLGDCNRNPLRLGYHALSPKAKTRRDAVRRQRVRQLDGLTPFARVAARPTPSIGGGGNNSSHNTGMSQSSSVQRRLVDLSVRLDAERKQRESVQRELTDVRRVQEELEKRLHMAA